MGTLRLKPSCGYFADQVVKGQLSGLQSGLRPFFGTYTAFCLDVCQSVSSVATQNTLQNRLSSRRKKRLINEYRRR